VNAREEVMEACELRIEHKATRDCAMPLRHALGAFLQALDLESLFCADVLSVAGEALSNTLEHAYKGHALGTVELYAREENAEKLLVAVRDHGTFIVHARNPERGFGFPIMHAIAGAVSIETGNGTRVQLLFDTSHKHGCISAYDAVVLEDCSAYA
jgi:anti-sigma regulatory factor (Ser/Thr protein kinase)